MQTKKDNWQAKWRQDKTTKKYKRYLKKREKAMIDSARRRLDKKNKETPIEYKNK